MSVRGKAMALSEELELSLIRRDFADPGEGEVRIRVDWAGLCGSDLHVIRTGDWVEAWPAVLGHELYGRVDAVGPAVDREDLREGDPVVVDSRFTTGDAGTTFVGEACEGGFAEYCVLPQQLLLRVPGQLEGSIAVLAEPLAVVLHALARIPAEPARALILGHGPVGALVHIELRRRHPDLEVAVAEPSEGRRELAGALGAEIADAAASLPADHYDLIVDCAGFAGSLGAAAAASAPGATVLVLAITDAETGLTTKTVVEKDLFVAGANGFDDELPHAVDLLLSDPDAYRPVVTRAVDLDELPALIGDQLRRPEEVKVLVRL